MQCTPDALGKLVVLQRPIDFTAAADLLPGRGREWEKGKKQR